MLGVTNSQGTISNRRVINKPQVWFPFDGNLNNTGSLSGISITNNGATVNNNGKIGKCYNFAGSASMDISPAAMNTLTTEATVCFWFKINSWNAAWDTLFQAGIDDPAWIAYHFGILRNNTGNNLCFVISNGSSATQQSCTTLNFSLGVWHHIACVYRTGQMLVYLDGALHKNFSTNIVPNFAGITKIKLGGLTNTYKTKSDIDDLRIYAAALSWSDINDLIYTNTYGKGSEIPLVHFPLDGNLENHGGMSDVTLINSGATINNNGKIGKCYNFAGNALMDISPEAMQSLGAEATVCFWFKINSWNAAYDTLFQAGLGTTPWTAYYFGILRDNTTNHLCFCISNGSTATQNGCCTIDFANETWHHIACTFMMPGQILIYLDGTLHAGPQTAVIPNFAGITSIKLGGLTSTYKSKADIDDFRIYSRALTGYEISNLAINNTKYSVDEHTVFLLTNSLEDQSSHHYTITNNGVILNSSTMRDGRGSLFFDGSSSHLRVPAAVARTGTSDWTIEYWIYPLVNKSSALVYYQNGGNVSTSGWAATDNPYGILIGYGSVSPYRALYLGNTESTGYGNGISAVAMGTNSSLNIWKHYAVVRSGNTIKVFENGQLIVNQEYTQTIPTPPADVTIGWYHYNNVSYNTLHAYIQDFRISDVARYTSNFTPPIRFI